MAAPKLKIRKGDTVEVTSGKDLGRRVRVAKKSGKEID